MRAWACASACVRVFFAAGKDEGSDRGNVYGVRVHALRCSPLAALVKPRAALRCARWTRGSPQRELRANLGLATYHYPNRTPSAPQGSKLVGEGAASCCANGSAANGSAANGSAEKAANSGGASSKGSARSPAPGCSHRFASGAGARGFNLLFQGEGDDETVSFGCLPSPHFI